MELFALFTVNVGPIQNVAESLADQVGHKNSDIRTTTGFESFNSTNCEQSLHQHISEETRVLSDVKAICLNPNNPVDFVDCSLPFFLPNT